MILNALHPYQNYFVPKIPLTPTNRYASIILLRETKSYAIFTTEGGGQQDVEQVPAGLNHTEPITRLVMFKRKQVATERRTGKASLRQYGVFPYGILATVDQGKVKEVHGVYYGEEAFAAPQEKAKGSLKFFRYDDCYLTEGLCTHCPDCLIYGYAAIEGEGARRARLMTDTCFTIRPYQIIQKHINFNVIDEASHTSGTITEYDYTTPGVFLPSVETTVDLSADEFVYVLSNILRTTRYGKEGSRQGFVRNHILAIAFSDVELFANLEFTQAFYDKLVDAGKDLASEDLSLVELQGYAPTVIEQLTSGLTGRLTLVTGETLDAILQEVQELYRDEERLRKFLRDLNTQSASFVV
jgi:CRISPR-associated protein Csc2